MLYASFADYYSERCRMSEEDVVMLSGGEAAPEIPVKKPKPADAIAELLKKKPPVDILEGSAVYISQQSSIPIKRRYGLPVLDKKTREPKQFLGAFKNAEEVTDWLAARKADGKLNEKRMAKALDDLTAYIQLPANVREAFEQQVGVLAGNANVPKEKKQKIKKEKTEEKPVPKEKKPKAPKKPVVTASETPASTAPKKKSSGSGGGFLLYPIDGVPANKEALASSSANQKTFKQVTDAMDINGSSITRLEIVALPDGSGVLLRRLEAPSASVLKTIAKLTRKPLESLKVDKERGKDDKYTAVLKRSSLKAFVSLYPAAKLPKAEKKQKAKKEKVVEQKQEKVKKVRATKAKSA